MHRELGESILQIAVKVTLRQNPVIWKQEHNCGILVRTYLHKDSAKIFELKYFLKRLLCLL
eukprot:m.276536 g.276536  ORF g.276536 m.276536 type:complete len:61 (+) comp40605_c0_seq40:1171-1353(+)